MIGYYFQSNEQDAASAFKECAIPLTGALKGYVDDMMDYLAQEYNTPVSYFLSFTSPEDIKDAFESGIPAHEFVNIANMNDPHIASSANILIYGDKKVNS